MLLLRRYLNPQPCEGEESNWVVKIGFKFYFKQTKKPTVVGVGDNSRSTNDSLPKSKNLNKPTDNQKVKLDWDDWEKRDTEVKGSQSTSHVTWTEL